MIHNIPHCMENKEKLHIKVKKKKKASSSLEQVYGGRYEVTKAENETKKVLKLTE